MENALAVHVVNGYQELINVVFDLRLLKVVAASSDQLVKVDVQELEDQSESSGWLIANFEAARTRDIKRGGRCGDAAIVV